MEDYAKWQLLLHSVSLYVSPLPDNSWKILRDIKFPKTAKLSDDTKLTCVELIETAMPLAVARPFVEEFITNSKQIQVIADVVRIIAVYVNMYFIRWVKLPSKLKLHSNREFQKMTGWMKSQKIKAKKR